MPSSRIELILALALVACGAGGDPGDGLRGTITAAARPVRSGRVAGWPEATTHLNVTIDGGDVSVAFAPAVASDLAAFWSIASTEGAGSGFFYSDGVQGKDDTKVAFAAGARRIQDVRDASALDYARPSVGPVERGGIVVLHHRPSDRYFALVLDGVTALDARTAGAGPYALADVRWYLTEPGSSDFSLAP